MGNKRTRDRQLAKQAAQRRQQRNIERRKRQATILTGLGIGLFAIVIVVLAFTVVGDDDPSPSAASAGCPDRTPEKPGGEKEAYPAPPPMTIDPTKSYSATMETSMGTIELDLLASGAPVTVNSFVFLSCEGFYDGLTFHRIVPDFVIQGGDPAGDGSGGPGYQFENEQPEGETYDGGGILAMANSGVDTNGSQFFITLAKSDALTPDLYTIFGRVTEGQKVVDEIADVPLKGETPVDPVTIDSITITES
ncbi:MAG: peptidylprolyl isomerase [Actinomycetota bacterium]